MIAADLRLAGNGAAIPGIERAFHGELAALSRAERRAIAGVVVAAVPATPIVAVADRGADVAAFETHVAGVRHRAGVGVGLAAFDVAWAAARDGHAWFCAGVSEIYIRLAGAIGKRDRDAVVIRQGVAALVA